jgi:hypothetical protein
VRFTVIIIVVIAVGFIVAFLFLRSRVADHGTLEELPQRLARLKQQDNDSRAFVGFCTRDEDAFYFVHQDGVFCLDYELTTLAKKNHADAFRRTAADLGYSVIDTSYDGQLPVPRVRAGASEMQAANVALEFTQRLFGNGPNTTFEFLP